MNYFLQELAKIYQTKEEHIEECKQCFFKEDIHTQQEIENADTDELIDELKKHNWTTTFENYCNAIKYELMIRNDFNGE